MNLWFKRVSGQIVLINVPISFCFSSECIINKIVIQTPTMPIARPTVITVIVIVSSFIIAIDFVCEEIVLQIVSVGIPKTA